MRRQVQHAGSPAADARPIAVLSGHEPSWWLRAQLVILESGWRSGEALGCPHLGAASIWLAALWRPDLMACPSCAHHIMATGTENHTCDRCRTVDPGVGPLAIEWRGILVTFGLCPSCFRLEVPA